MKKNLWKSRGFCINFSDRGDQVEIKNTKDCANARLNAVVYAPSKFGKSTLSGTLTGKTLIISLESGLLAVKNKSIDFVEVKDGLDSDGKQLPPKIKQIENICAELQKGVDYENIFFDSLTEIAEIFLEDSEKAFPGSGQTFQKFGHYGKRLKAFIKFTRDLSRYNIWFSCLMKTDTDNTGLKFHVPDIAGSMSTKLPQFFDLIMSIKIFTKEDEEKRMLLTQATEGYLCGDRSGVLDKYEPMNLQHIVDKILGEKK